MLTGAALDNLVAAVVRACRSGLDADALRAAVLPRLRKALPIDALWWAAADPATLFFTRSYREELPEESGPYFVENEFLRQDVNEWTELARDPAGVRTLMAAPAEVAPVIASAYGLTDREKTVCGLVCKGLPTRQISDQLHLTTDTVQDHLKSAFDKTGVHSRGELVATILRRDYLARAMADDPVSRSGAFAAG